MTRTTATHPALLALLLLAACSDSSAPPPPPKNVTPVDLATAGTIRVEVSYAGPAPTPKAINMRSVAACAEAHPQPVYDQSLVVADGRLANAVVYIRSGFGERGFAPPATKVVLDQNGCIYEPHVAAVMVGQALEFRNSDPEAHNVHGRPEVVNGWNFMMSRQNTTRDVYFDRPEVGIPVGCDIHPWMLAYVSVLDNPYFGVTPADGRVTLSQVPPGDYVVAVWHETLGTLEQAVTLPARGESSVRFTFQAPAG